MIASVGICSINDEIIHFTECSKWNIDMRASDRYIDNYFL